MKLHYLLIFLTAYLVYGEEIGDFCSKGSVEVGVVTRADNCEYVKKLKSERRYSAVRAITYPSKSSRKNACCPASKAVKACQNFHNKYEKKLINSYNNTDTDAKVGEFPYFASLAHIDNHQLSFACSGSLISESFVLTAAHCFDDKNKHPVIVRFGKVEFSLNSEEKEKDPNEIIDRDIKDLFLNNHYQIGQKYNDIALVQIDSSIPLPDRIRPACLHPLDNIPSTVSYVSRLTITGFGRNRSDGKQKSEWMKKGIVKEIGVNSCQSLFNKADSAMSTGLATKLDDGTICAGDTVTTESVKCNADPGSALQILKPDGYYIYGVASFGVSCDWKFPSIYTKVYYVMGWIEKIVWPSMELPIPN